MDHDLPDTDDIDSHDSPDLSDSLDEETTAADEADLDVPQLRQQLADATNRALRTQADLDNYRKRVAREQETERRYATISVMRDLLPVLDNIQRAIEAAEQSQDAPGLLEGFKLVAQQLQSVLAQHDCQPIDAEPGTTFDPNRHEAILQMPSDEHEHGQIVQTTQVGFQLHDRVVRPSQVIVSSGKTSD
jgi:molecular chaperone GrpE